VHESTRESDAHFYEEQSLSEPSTERGYSEGRSFEGVS